MYLRLIHFLWPLVVTIIIQEFGLQFLNAGMARMPQATQILAAFGLTWGLVLFLASPLAQAKQMSLVLVENRAAYTKTWRTVLGLSLLLMAAQASLALTPVGRWVIDDLHQVDAAVAGLVRGMLLWLVPLPLLRSATLYLSGILIRRRRTDLVSAATVAGIVVGIGSVFILLPLEFVRRQPIWLPVLVTYAMALVELVVVLRGTRRHVDFDRLATATATTHSPLTYGDILRFFWPLALITLVQDLSRPLINLFVARGPDGTVALAVLAVAYALGQWPYRWLNEIRSLPPAFQGGYPDLRHIWRFTLACGALSFGLSVLLFWTPLRDFLLLSLIGVDADLAQRARTPLVLYAFFSLVVTLRAYLHGLGLLERRTRAMAPSAPSRIGAIVLALLGLPFLGVHGATLGVAALLLGFTVETAVVWWGVRGRALVRNRRGEERYAL